MNIFEISDRQQLIDYLDSGDRVKYLYFWGHKKKNDAPMDKSCLSQWYEAAFYLDEIKYLTAEHYMMAEKARLFNDTEKLAKILAASHPGEAKKLGRSISGFN